MPIQVGGRGGRPRWVAAAGPPSFFADYGAYGTYVVSRATSGVKPLTDRGLPLTLYTNQFGTPDPVTKVLALSTPGASLDAFDIPFYVTVSVAGVSLPRSKIRGPATVPAGGAQPLVMSYDSGATGFVFKDCDMIPDAPNYLVGAGWQGRGTGERLYVQGCVDGYDLIGQGKLLACFADLLSYFTPDPTHGDNQSHNDAVQMEIPDTGSPGWEIGWCSLFGFCDPAIGQGGSLPTAILPFGPRPKYQGNSCMQFTATTPTTQNINVHNCLLDGGAATINVGGDAGKYGSNLGNFDGCTFGDNNAQAFTGVQYQVLLNVARATIGLTIGTTTPNTYGAVGGRALANPALAGTTVATGNGVRGG